MTHKPTRLCVDRDSSAARGDTHYPGPGRTTLAAYPPKERWDDWVELDPRAWPSRVEHRYSLVPTACFNCEAACGLLAYVDKDTGLVRKFEGNPEHPASRGRTCAKGPATLNQIEDPDRILHPLKRTGPRGANAWAEVSWDEALNDIAGRIRKAIQDGRHNEVMYHVGRPGEDGFTERVLAAWGVDGHNSHTNICSSGARAGYQFWTGSDRPSPDHEHANVILLISAHLESGHYFNPHAQRIIDGTHNGAKLIVFDVRLSNTASHADHWLAPYPGSEPAILLAIASYLVRTGRYNREFVRHFWNWQEFMEDERPGMPTTFEHFEQALRDLYASYTFAYAQQESGVDATIIEQVAEIVSKAGTKLSTHSWRAAAAGAEGGWQVARTLFLLNALMGAVSTEGGTYPNSLNKFVARPIHTPPPPREWNELTWPQEYPLSMNELSFLLPHLLKDGRGRLEVYFSRVYNPVWINPDGCSWIEALSDESKVGLHVALTPTWSETAFFADYVLPMGLASERHDIHSYETHDSQWIGFRQPVTRAAATRDGKAVADTRHTNPGEVWEENEFWMELSWRIDPDGSMGIRQYFESRANPGQRLTVDEYYSYMFEHSVPGLPEKAHAEQRSPLDYMRHYGAFEVARQIGPVHEQRVPIEELRDTTMTRQGRVFASTPKPDSDNLASTGAPDGDGPGRRPVGIMVEGRVVRGFPTPSGRLEFYSSTLKRWGWPEYTTPTYIKSHVHPDRLEPGEMPLVPNFRIPVQIHTRSGNSKWLDEIAHTNPLWIHPTDAARFGIEKTGDLVKVETRIGHFIVKAWITEGIRPGVVACSHHMGRWRTHENGQRQVMGAVSLDRVGTRWRLRRLKGVEAFESSDPDTARIWWNDCGVHQNLTFPVQPDPISGMHCWHQAVRISRATGEDQYGDVVVDTAHARAQYADWLARARPASAVSPDGTRRPYWLMRPLRPTRDAYRLRK
jgi:anaerobic selenocysteine-containing dehydrogenase